MSKIDVYRVHFNAYKHTPLALGNVVTMVKEYHPNLLEVLNFQTPWLINGKVAAQKQFVNSLSKPAIFLMSDYIWNTRPHLAFSKLLKANNQAHIIIHGGPSVPKNSRIFLRNHPEVDFAIQGEGEVTLMELFSHMFSGKNYHQINGLIFRESQDVILNAPRKRIQHLSKIPSPYLEGEFDSLLNTTPPLLAAILETNRGCPYGCTFCDWGGATLQKIRNQDIDRVFAELEWMAMNRIPILWIADANFGIFERDVTITEYICKLKERYNYPNEVIVNYAKNGKIRIAEIVRMLAAAKILTKGTVSIQTTDDETLKIIRRKNIKTKNYIKLMNEFRKNDLVTSVQLMIGLPGSTYESFKIDIEKFLVERLSIMAYTTVILPNSPMAQADYRKEHGIVTDLFLDKHDEEYEVIIATNSLSTEAFRQVHLLNSFVYFAVCCRTLKYISYMVATEKQVKQVDFLEHLFKLGESEIAKQDEAVKYPILRKIVESLTQGIDNFIFNKVYSEKAPNVREIILEVDGLNQWNQFYAEIKEILRIHYTLDEKIIDTVVNIQKRILPSLHNPLTDIYLDYDFVSYYAQDIYADSKKPLSSFAAPTVFSVEDPRRICSAYELVRRYLVTRSGVYFELNSDLWKTDGIPDFNVTPPVVLKKAA